MLPDIDLARIEDLSARAVIVASLNVVEELRAEVRTLGEENRRLRDENQRLQGEQGQPTTLPKVLRSTSGPSDSSSSW